MSARVTIIGKVKDFRKIKHPEKDHVTLYGLDFIEGGQGLAPRHLPVPSEVHYTVLLNERQMNKLRRSLGDKTPIGQTLFLEGEINLDLPLSLVVGEIGILAFKIGPYQVNEQELVQTNLLEDLEMVDDFYQASEAPQDNNMTVCIEEIQIPVDMQKKLPLPKKVNEIVRYYQSTGNLDKPITVSKTKEGLTLKDGYARYIAAKELGLKNISIVLNALQFALFHDYILDFLTDINLWESLLDLC